MHYRMLAIIVCFVVGCGGRTDRLQKNATEQLAAEAHRQVGMPAVTRFTERKLLKRLYEIRDDEKLVMYCYLSDLNGGLHFLCKCFGYGIPYATQFTNPMRTIDETHGTIPQPEPNGLFMPASADATWVMMVGSDGKPHPIYVEPKVVISPLPLPQAKGNPAD